MIKFINLHEFESGKPHCINVRHLERFADNEVWINGKRYKVKETMQEILIAIQSIKHDKTMVALV